MLECYGIFSENAKFEILNVCLHNVILDYPVLVETDLLS